MQRKTDLVSYRRLEKMIVSIHTSILACLLISAAISQTVAEYKCISSNHGASKVSINNRRNESGHLISQVEFERTTSLHQGALAAKDANLWTVDVEQTTDNCEGAEYVAHLTFTITAPFLQPASGYELFPGIGYYKFHDDIASWPRAREICAEEGAHLVIINSEKESDVTKKLFAKFPKITGVTDNNYAWVGAREIEGVNAQYVTIHDDPLNSTGFMRWSPTEPNNPTAGDYLLVNRANGGLADVPIALGWKQPFICEQELG